MCGVLLHSTTTSKVQAGVLSDISLDSATQMPFNISIFYFMDNNQCRCSTPDSHCPSFEMLTVLIMKIADLSSLQCTLEHWTRNGSCKWRLVQVLIYVMRSLKQCVKISCFCTVSHSQNWRSIRSPSLQKKSLFPTL